MGGSLSQMNAAARDRQEELARLRAQVPPGVNLDEGIPFKGSWIGSVIGIAIAFPIGIKRKSLNPLVYYGGTGAMLDVIFSVSDYEQQREKRLRDYVAKIEQEKNRLAADAEANDSWVGDAIDRGDDEEHRDKATVLKD